MYKYQKVNITNVASITSLEKYHCTFLIIQKKKCKHTLGFLIPLQKVSDEDPVFLYQKQYYYKTVLFLKLVLSCSQ